MRILGIDYGRKKVGIAITDGNLAEPLEVVRYKDPNSLYEKIENLIIKFEIEKAVVGISEGKMKEESESFGKTLGSKLKMPVEMFDETLSTISAQELSIAAGIKRIKRRNFEDAYAASVMLQSYLDNHV